MKPNDKPGYSAKLLSKLHQRYFLHEDTMVRVVIPPKWKLPRNSGKPVQNHRGGESTRSPRQESFGRSD